VYHNTNGVGTLETLRRENRALARAYELKEYLATILEQATPEEAPALLEEWLSWAARSRLALVSTQNRPLGERLKTGHFR